MKTDKNNIFNNEGKKKLFLSLLLLVSSVALFWFALKEDNAADSDNDLISLQQNDDSVNNHLRKTARKIEVEKMKARVEAISQLKNNSEPSNFRNQQDSRLKEDFSADPRVDELAEALGKKSKTPSEPKDPGELVQARLYDQQKWNEYTLAYRQAYADKFIENARRNGWIIKLNDDYKIISAKPVKKDLRPQLFPANKTADSTKVHSAN